MRTIRVLIICTLTIMLYGCRASQPPQAETAPEPTPPALRLDSATVTTPPSLLGRLLGQKAKPGIPVSLPQIGKKSTVSIYYGPATVTTTTVGKKATAATADGAVAITPAKKSGPVVLADSGATVQVATSQKGPAAAAGRDATATTIKPSTPWLKYALWAGGLGLAGWVLFGGGGAVLLALWRRSRSSDTQS